MPWAFASDDTPVLACSTDKLTAYEGEKVKINTWLLVPENRDITYRWKVDTGKIIGKGDSVIWALEDTQPDVYVASVYVNGFSQFLECSVSVIVKPSARGSKGSDNDFQRESGWGLLLAGEHEKPGYGLYSYLLFAAPPDDSNREKYRKVIESYLFTLPEIKELEKQLLELGDTRLDLNITYLLLKQQPKNKNMLTVDWILKHYHYARARALLKTLHGNHRNGPYVISSLTPFFSDGRLSKNHLIQNMTHVPSHIISLWAREYFSQAAQERFWELDGIKRFALKLRQTVAVLAIALPPIKDAVNEWISWSN